MHPLLERQLRKAFAGQLPGGEAFDRFAQAVEAAYVAADEDRTQLERSLSLASDELFERNRRLESELEERKRLELELRLAEKMRAVGQLAAGVAHEINTPVQYVGDSLYFLQGAWVDIAALLDAYEEAVAAAKEGGDLSRFAQVSAKLAELAERANLPFMRKEIPAALTRCQDGAERVTKIVRALKELAHPGDNQKRPADINAAIENTLIVVANEIKYSADVELHLDAMQEVVCNLDEIHQVLLNLIVNAAHAITERVGQSGERGHICIATREEGSDLIIRVQDDGVGISPEIRDRIFEPFFTTKPVGKGTGQGLSIVHSLVVDRHGGQVTVDSAPGKGATFLIRLPISARAGESGG